MWDLVALPKKYRENVMLLYDTSKFRNKKKTKLLYAHKPQVEWDKRFEREQLLVGQTSTLKSTISIINPIALLPK